MQHSKHAEKKKVGHSLHSDSGSSITSKSIQQSNSSALEKRKLRVLLVDNEPSTRTMYLMFLNGIKSNGLSIVDMASAKSGSEALSMLEAAASSKHPFDLVIADNRMEGMYGTELVRKIKADAQLSGTFVAILSTMANNAEVLSSGADLAVQKGATAIEPLRRLIAERCAAISE